MQPYILSSLPCLWRIEVPARRYHSFQLNYQLWYLLGCRHAFIRRWVCCLMTSFTAINFLYGTVIIPRVYLKQSILSRALCFETTIAAIHYIKWTGFTSRTAAQKMKFSLEDFFSKCDQIHRKLRLWSHLLKRSLMKTSFFVHWTFEGYCVYLRKAIATPTFLRYLFFCRTSGCNFCLTGTELCNHSFMMNVLIWPE